MLAGGKRRWEELDASSKSSRCLGTRVAMSAEGYGSREERRRRTISAELSTR
jgi:hypothetical protein